MRDTREKRNCLQCEKEHLVPQLVLRNGNGKFCSNPCKNLYLWGTKEYREKQIASHKGITPKGLAQLIKYNKSEIGRKITSTRIKGQTPWNKGLECPNMRGEKSVHWIVDRNQVKIGDRTLNDPLQKQWRRSVKDRDNWACRIADINCDGRLEAHHILRWADFPELRYEVNNGITLCHFHHPRKRNDEIRLSPYFQELVKVQ